LIKVKNFLKFLNKNGVNFFTGVPDSLLKSFCLLVEKKLNKKKHIISANEGSALGLAAGYHLATNEIPLIYLQNSGFGNIINPLLSLIDKKVYSIPVIFLMGWRGESGVHDEPQHLTQGNLTLDFIKILKSNFYILKGNEKKDYRNLKIKIRKLKLDQKPLFILVKKNIFDNIKIKKKIIKNKFKREQAIKCITEILGNQNKYISTTGMISRELYEIREKSRDSHELDFLTVGSMGHSSQIALGYAVKTKKNVVCLDGDGAFLMHMGSVATIGDVSPNNLTHILLNNNVHDSVGGQRTASQIINYPGVARACGYKKIFSKIDSLPKLKLILKKIKKIKGLKFIECIISPGYRKDLGRPKETPVENKKSFMKK
jgi:phosphonopyruvate decarboxylase